MELVWISTENYWLSFLCKAGDTDEQLCLIGVIVNDSFSQKLALL